MGERSGKLASPPPDDEGVDPPCGGADTSQGWHSNAIHEVDET